MSYGVEKRTEEPQFVSMTETRWNALSVFERMKACFAEAGEIRNYSCEQKSILAIGLYKAYQDKWGV